MDALTELLSPPRRYCKHSDIPAGTGQIRISFPVTTTNDTKYSVLLSERRYWAISLSILELMSFISERSQLISDRVSGHKTFAFCTRKLSVSVDIIFLRKYPRFHRLNCSFTQPSFLSHFCSANKQHRSIRYWLPVFRPQNDKSSQLASNQKSISPHSRLEKENRKRQCFRLLSRG